MLSNEEVAGIIIAVVIGSIMYWFFWDKCFRYRKYPPEVASRVPFFGNLKLLKHPCLGQYLLDRSLETKEPVMTLQLGKYSTVVCNDQETIREAFQPKFNALLPWSITACEIWSGNGYDMSYATGVDWWNVRMLITISMDHLEKELGYENIIEKEIDNLISHLGTFVNDKKTVKMMDHLPYTQMNLTSNLTVGVRWDRGDELGEKMLESLTVFKKYYDAPPTGDFVSILHPFAPSTNAIWAAKSDFREIYDAELDAHVKYFDRNKKKPRDLLDYVLRNRELISLYHEVDDTRIFNAVISNFHMSSFTLLPMQVDFILAHMPCRPRLQTQIFQELRRHCGSTPPRLCDMGYLPLTEATIKEGIRIRTMTALGMLHTAHADTHIGKYPIKKGTKILPNLWALHMNPRYWKDPTHFRPARWLEKEGPKNIKKGRYCPFGEGSDRECPGKQFAQQTMFMIFANIMYNFKVRMPKPGQQADESFSHFHTQYGKVLLKWRKKKKRGGSDSDDEDNSESEYEDSVLGDYEEQEDSKLRRIVVEHTKGAAAEREEKSHAAEEDTKEDWDDDGAKIGSYDGAEHTIITIYDDVSDEDDAE